MYPFPQTFTRPPLTLPHSPPHPAHLQRSPHTLIPARTLHLPQRRHSPEKQPPPPQTITKSPERPSFDRSILFQPTSPRQDINQKLKNQDSEYKLGYYADLISKLRVEERKNEILAERIKYRIISNQVLRNIPQKIRLPVGQVLSRSVSVQPRFRGLHNSITQLATIRQYDKSGKKPDNRDNKELEQYKKETDLEIRHLLQVIEDLRREKKQKEENEGGKGDPQSEELEKNRQELQKLRDENLKLKYGQDLTQISAQNSQFQKKWEGQKKQYENEISDLKNENKQLQNGIKSAEADLQIFKQQFEALKNAQRNDAGDATKGIEQEQRISDLTIENFKLQQTVRDLEQRLGDQQKTIQLSEEENVKQRSLVQELEQQLKQSREENEQYFERFRQESDKLTLQLQQLDALQGKIHDQNQKIDDLSKQKNEKDRQIQDLQDEINDLKASQQPNTGHSEDELVQLQQKFNSLQSEKTFLENEKINLETKCANQEDEIQQMKKLNKQLETSIDEIRENYQKIYTQEINDLKGEIQEKQDKIEAQQSQVFKQELQIKDLQFQLKNNERLSNLDKSRSEISGDFQPHFKTNISYDKKQDNLTKSQKSSQRSKEDTKQLYQKLRRQSQNTAAFLSSKFDFGAVQNSQINEQIIKETQETIEKEAQSENTN